MKTRQPLRQGDILLIPVAKRDVPKNLIEVPRDKRGRIVLAEGEVTGHAHAILDDSATLFQQADLDEMADRFLKVEAEVSVVHEEHNAVVTGQPARNEDWWIVRHKREYRPQEIVRVAD